MPSLDIISVNLWQILISLCNLLILYWILKRFLYKPVKDMVAKRNEQLQAQYDKAAQAQEKAGESQAQWERKLAGAQAEADSLVKTAQTRAAKSSDKIVAEAKDRADSILRQARRDAELERKRAQAQMQQEIVDVSACLTEKLLEREIRQSDHDRLIDSFLQELGEQHDGNQ